MLNAVNKLIRLITGSRSQTIESVSSKSNFDQRRGRDEVLYRQNKMQKSKGLYTNYWADFLDRKAKD